MPARQITIQHAHVTTARNTQLVLSYSDINPDDSLACLSLSAAPLTFSRAAALAEEGHEEEGEVKVHGQLISVSTVAPSAFS